MNTKAIRAIKDLKENRDFSLYKEIFNHNIDRLDNVAIEYRCNKITFREMFRKVDEYAVSLQSMGFKKGSEVLVCISNSPEFIYMLLASSKIGAKFNTIGEWFDRDYLEMIISKNGSGYLFLSDDNYEYMKDVIDESDDIQRLVMFSLHDSLPTIAGMKIDLFKEIDRQFKSFEGDVEYHRLTSNKEILDQEEFLLLGREYACEVLDIDYDDEKTLRRGIPLEKISLEDDFIITYTSGSTDPGKPKATLHPVKSLSILARFKESDVSGMPTMKNVKVMSHIPSYVLANISTSITDPLYLGCTVICEPIYDKDFFPYAIALNKPNMSGGSVGFWRNLFMKMNSNDYFFKTLECPGLFLPIVTGEAMGPGEEKFFNRMAKKHKFGVDKLPFPLAPVTFSIGGGTNEITGIFVTLFRSLQEKNPMRLLKKAPYGQTPLACADVDIVNENFESVDVGEYGEIVAKTECGMRGYYYRPDLDETVMKKCEDGSIIYKMGAYGLKLDNMPHLQIKGRMSDFVELSNGEVYPLFKIDDIVAKDTKNILSSSVIKIMNGDAIDLVIHVEPQPFGRTLKSEDAILESILKRLDGKIPEELKDSIYFRYRTTEESFPVAPSGKRFTVKLVEEGLEQAIPYRYIENLVKGESDTPRLTHKK